MGRRRGFTHCLCSSMKREAVAAGDVAAATAIIALVTSRSWFARLNPELNIFFLTTRWP